MSFLSSYCYSDISSTKVLKNYLLNMRFDLTATATKNFAKYVSGREIPDIHT
jgi:hypothetical protein